MMRSWRILCCERAQRDFVTSTQGSLPSSEAVQHIRVAPPKLPSWTALSCRSISGLMLRCSFLKADIQRFSAIPEVMMVAMRDKEHTGELLTEAVVRSRRLTNFPLIPLCSEARL